MPARCTFSGLANATSRRLRLGFMPWHECISESRGCSQVPDSCSSMTEHTQFNINTQLKDAKRLYISYVNEASRPFRAFGPRLDALALESTSEDCSVPLLMHCHLPTGAGASAPLAPRKEAARIGATLLGLHETRTSESL